MPSLLLPGLLTAATVVLWATSALPEYLTALLFFTVATVAGISTPEIVFSGFLSAAFWLVLSGFVIGAAIRKVGLADRVAAMLAPHLARSWPRMVVGVVGLTAGLAFVMPSNMGRITLLIPIVMALADRAGLGPGSRGRMGLALAVGCGTFQISAAILPANVPNLVMAGAAESSYGIRFTYLSYLLLHGPVTGLGKALVLIGCTCVLFRDRPVQAAAGPAPGPLSAAETRLSVLLLATLALWMTDSLHGIQPAWVGLASACVCLLPRVGFLTSDEFTAGVNIRTCIYVAGILGLATLVARSGLGDALGRAVIPLLPLDPERPRTAFAALVGLAGMLDLIVTGNGVPALFTPLARALAEATAIPLKSVLMIQVLGYASPFLPYQASPLVVAMEMAKVPAREGVRLCLALAAVTFVVLVPLDALWFQALGWLPLR